MSIHSQSVNKAVSAQPMWTQTEDNIYEGESKWPWLSGCHRSSQVVTGRHRSSEKSLTVVGLQQSSALTPVSLINCINTDLCWGLLFISKWAEVLTPPLPDPPSPRPPLPDPLQWYYGSQEVHGSVLSSASLLVCIFVHQWYSCFRVDSENNHRPNRWQYCNSKILKGRCWFKCSEEA